MRKPAMCVHWLQSDPQRLGAQIVVAVVVTPCVDPLTTRCSWAETDGQGAVARRKTVLAIKLLMYGALELHNAVYSLFSIMMV